MERYRREYGKGTSASEVEYWEKYDKSREFREDFPTREEWERYKQVGRGLANIKQEGTYSAFDPAVKPKNNVTLTAKERLQYETDSRLSSIKL